MDNKNESPNYSDDNIMESFGSTKVEYSYPMLVMIRVQDCGKKRAEEMIYGFWNTVVDRHGVARKTWVQDTRNVFISSVVALLNLLAPKIKEDKKFQEEYEKLEKKITKSFDNFCYEDYEPNNLGNGEIRYKKNEIKYIPQVDAEVFMVDVRTGLLTNIKGGWNLKRNAYYDSILILYDKIFAELNNLIDRLGYFKKRPVFG